MWLIERYLKSASEHVFTSVNGIVNETASALAVMQVVQVTSLFRIRLLKTVQCLSVILISFVVSS